MEGSVLRTKWLGALMGGLVGLGAPIGSIFFHQLFSGGWSFEAAVQEVRGHLFYYDYMVVATPLIFSAFGFYLGTLKDRVTEQNDLLERLNSLLQQEAMIDDVTGLLNRRHLDLATDREIERARRYRHGISGMMIDIDDFKDINDRFGHLVGDRVLKRVASVVQQGLRKIDIIGRYGGDEFMVVLPETTLENAKIVANRVQEYVRAIRIEVPTPSITVTVSIGLFSFPNCEFLDRKAFVELVDLAMLKAKQAGKNRIVSG